MKEKYYYLFYKFYLFADWSPSIFPSDLVAASMILVLEIFTGFSLINYHDVYMHHHGSVDIFSWEIAAPMCFLLFINYACFLHSEKWKVYFLKFDQLDDNKNLKGTWLVILIVVIILVNLVVSFCLNPPPDINS